MTRRAGQRPLRRWLPWLMVLGSLMTLVGAWALDWPGGITAVDLNQHRLNVALPAPEGAQTLTQRFIPTHDGLVEIELLLVRFDEEPERDDGRFALALFDDRNHLVGQETLATAGISHNQAHTFRFPMQPDSAGRAYTLQLSGSPGNRISAWGYDLDVYDGVALGPGDQSGDLRFTTRYRLSWRTAVAQLATMLRRDGALLLLALLLIPLPGVLLLSSRRGWPERWDGGAWWGTTFALGAAVWPILWSWLTLAGGRFTAPLLWALLILGWGTAVWLHLRRRRDRRSPLPFPSAPLLLILIAGTAVRLLAVRDLAFPAWVDASRHGLITAITAASGQMLTDYLPHWTADRLPYHYGFHTLAAGLHLSSGAPLPGLLLALGQLLNGLAPLAVYTSGWLLTRRRWAGLLAAFLVALPLFFPAYYATWGRFTQLTGMLILPVLLGLTWRMVNGARRWRGAWPLVGLLAAGLFLVHFRVFLFYLPFAGLAGLMLVARRGADGRWRAMTGAGLLAIVLAGPRLLLLLRRTEPAGALRGTIADYNRFPTGYVDIGWEEAFYGLAAAGLLLAVLFFLLRRARWTAVPLTLAAWVGSLFLLLAGRRLGLPESNLININSLVISLYLPVSLVIGIVVAQLWRWARRGHGAVTVRPAHHGAAVFALLLGGGLAAAGLFGGKQQATILNEETILAWPADQPALAWADAHLPPDAHVAVNSWNWLGNTWAGGDGGAWLTPLTDRKSTTPPVDYIYNRELALGVIDFNTAAMAIDDWSTPEAADFLRRNGVTHVFVGARGGFLDPAELARNRQMTGLYAADGVFIFAINDS